MANRTKFTPKKRAEFLALVADGHTVTFAARAIGVSRNCIFDHRHAEPDFDADVEAAFAEGGEVLEDEARRRAVGGVSRTFYDREGNPTETTTTYSDTLLIFLLKGRFPDKYKDRVKQEQQHSGEVVLKVVFETAPKA